MEKVLVLGGSGFVGSNLVRHFSTKHEVFFTYCSTPRSEIHEHPAALQLDICDYSAVQTVLPRLMPTVVVHAAGVKDVRACEANSEWAFDINAEGSSNVAKACREIGAWLIYLSTDLVFGCDRGAYREDEIPTPTTAYGRSKLAGEEMARSETDDLTVCRSGGLYGQSSPLLAWVAGELEAGRKIVAFTDVMNTPTYCVNLAEMLDAVMQRRLTGIFHTTGPARVSRYTLFATFARTFGHDVQLLEAKAAGDSRKDLLLQADASLSGNASALRLGVARDGIEQGMARLRAEGDIG